MSTGCGLLLHKELQDVHRLQLWSERSWKIGKIYLRFRSTSKVSYLHNQATDLVEDWLVNSYWEYKDTLGSKSFRFSNSFYSKVGIYVHLAVPYEAKVRNQWTDLAENRAVSSYSHLKATLWSKSFRFSNSFHSKDGLYVHLGIAQKATIRILSDGVPALPSIPSSHLKPVPCLGEDMPILVTTYGLIVRTSALFRRGISCPLCHRR